MIASSLFEIILADFRFPWKRTYTKVDMIPAMGIENGSKENIGSLILHFRILF
jgi:hypothetical protein